MKIEQAEKDFGPSGKYLRSETLFVALVSTIIKVSYSSKIKHFKYLT